jgi:hypothetical protein
MEGIIFDLGLTKTGVLPEIVRRLQEIGCIGTQMESFLQPAVRKCRIFKMGSPP